MKYFYVVVLLAISCQANAKVIGGKVKGFIISESGSARIRLVEHNSECVTGNSGWDYSYSIESTQGNLWSSMILAARMADKVIRIVYTPNSSGSCAVQSIYFYDY